MQFRCSVQDTIEHNISNFHIKYTSSIGWNCYTVHQYIYFGKQNYRLFKIGQGITHNVKATCTLSQMKLNFFANLTALDV